MKHLKRLAVGIALLTIAGMVAFGLAMFFKLAPNAALISLAVGIILGVGYVIGMEWIG